MRFRLSQQFTGWVPRAGNTVSESAEDESICIADAGGEIRFYVRADAAGRFALTRAERSDAEQLVLCADDLSDIERFLIVTLAGVVRRKDGHGRLQIPAKADELAEGFQIVHRDGFVWLDDGQRPTICFVEEDPYMPQPAVQFSHYANASMGDIISSIDADSGAPVFST